MMIETSKGVLKPVGELKAFFSRVLISQVLRSRGSLGLLEGRHDAVVVGNIAEQPDGDAQGGDFIGNGQIDDAGLAVHLRSAKLFRGDVLAENRLDHAGPGQAEKGILRLDEKAPLARQIAAAAGIETEHAHDARHDAADLAQGGEGLGVAVEAADAGRHEGAGAVVHADQGNPLLAGHVEKAGQLVAVGGIDGAGAHGEVMAVERDIAAVDIQNGGDQGGAVEILPPVLVENVRLLVGEDADAFPDRHPFFEMLFFDLLDAAPT